MTPGEASLLVDVSNGRTKFTVLQGDGVFSPVRMLPTHALTPPAIRDLLAGLVYTRATVACVVPEVADLLAEALGCPVYFLSAAGKLNLAVQYDPPVSLGADRLACAMALAQQGGLPAIAVDAGTAVTFDVVVQQQCGGASYIGGAIAPGLRTMMHALSSRTALLPEVGLQCLPPAIGGDTRSCLRSGLVHGFAGMVQGILDSLAAGLPSPPRIVFTGGDAAFLASLARFSVDCDNWLVFKGLALADKLNH